MEDYVNGFIERREGGRYEGRVTIDGINLGTIEAVYFKKDEDSYLWLKRRKVLEYDDVTMTYNEREPKPKWEAYLKKQMNNDTVAYKGVFTFMRFRYSIEGVWDRILGTDTRRRLNLFVERLPMNQQTIINNINDRKRQENGTHGE